jgi:hypothetical protein
MRLLTYLELSRYSKAQLWDLYRQNMAALPEIPEGSIDHQNALLNIQHLRLFMARPNFTPC